MTKENPNKNENTDGNPNNSPENRIEDPEAVSSAQPGTNERVIPAGGKFVNNRFLKIDTKTKEFFCSEHPHIKSKSIGPFNRHFLSIHGMSVQGEKISAPSTPSKQPTPQPEGEKLRGETSQVKPSVEILDSDPEDVKELKRQIIQRMQEESEKDNLDAKATELALNYDLERRAKAVARILANPDVNFLLSHSMLDRVFPPEWDEGDIIREALFLLLNKMGVETYFKQNMNLVDPDFKTLVLKIQKSWEGYKSQNGKSEMVVAV